MMTVRQARSTRDLLLGAVGRLNGEPTFEDLTIVALALAQAQLKVTEIIASTHASYLPSPTVTP